MTSSITTLFESGVLLLDGGLGSSLIARGLEAGRCPELWNIEHPDEIMEIHAAYFAAGSDVVHTNTFGGNSFVLAKHGLENRMEELNRAAVEIARKAAGPNQYVAGDIGPSGLMLPPVGKADPLELEEGFHQQAAVLAEAGADYLAIETMMDLKEALCALRGARRATKLPITACVTLDHKKRGFFTLMGNTPEDCVKALADEGAVAVGANCSVSSDVMLELCPLLVAAAPVPVIVKPNAGKPLVVDGKASYAQSAEEFAQDLSKMVDLGARAVGGCCGTNDVFIAALKKRLDGKSREKL